MNERLFKQKMEERKQKIIDAAKALFSEKGYAGTGLREIAERAGVSLGNIYNYFKNKEEIFSEIFNPEAIGATLINSFGSIQGDFPFNMSDIILMIKKAVDSNIDLYRLYYIDIIEFGAKNTNRLIGYFITLSKSVFREQLDREVKKGNLRDLDYDLLAKQFIISMITFFSSIHEIPAMKVEEYSDEELSRIMGEVLLRGITK